MNCNIKKKLTKGNAADDIEGQTFCRQQFPDKFLDFKYNETTKEIECEYRRFRYCKNHTQALVLGNECVFLLNKTDTRKEADNACKRADVNSTVLDSEVIQIARFLRGVYKWTQPTKAIWYASRLKNKTSLMYTDWIGSIVAIGSYRPGQIVYFNGNNNEVAPVVCIKKAQSLPGG